MSTIHRRPHDPTLPTPSLWELEWRVVDVACGQLDLDRAEVTPDSRLVEDLNVDSLEVVEFLMAVEEEFDVELPADEPGRIFSERGRLRDVAAWVHHAWGSCGSPARQKRGGGAKQGTAELLPFLQLGGRLSPGEWLDGPLYEPIGTNREGFSQFRRRTDGMRCVLIPGGDVWLGSTTAGSSTSHNAARRVQLSPFLMDAEPVSTTAFARFLNSVRGVGHCVEHEWCDICPGDRRRRQFPLRRPENGWVPRAGTEQQPMILVSWYGANAYALWANRRDWRRYRGDGSIPPRLRNLQLSLPDSVASRLSGLPSEAQWEYAARGCVALTEPTGAQPADRMSGEAAGWVARHQPGMEYRADTLPAAPVSERRGMSPFGLHHMAGNVWQWCRDWYTPDYYPLLAASAKDPEATEPTGVRSERGGSWVGPAHLAHPSYRRGRPPGARGRCLGFRCIGSVEDLS